MYKKMDLPYGAFPIFDKVAGIGKHASAVYRFLTGRKKPDIKWNYELFLVNSAGQVERRFRSSDIGSSKGRQDVENAIDALIA